MAEPPFVVSHIVFDVDDTLVDFSVALRHAQTAAAERLSVLTTSIVSPAMLQQVRDLVVVEPQYANRMLAEARRESFRRILEAAEITDDAVVDEVNEIFFRTRAETTPVYPDVRGTLDELRVGGFTLIAASNGNLDLSVPDLDRYFDATLAAADVEYLKPDPRFFRDAVAAAGGTPERALSVGDRIENDYEPAQLAGLESVLIDRDARVQDTSVRRISSLSELLEMVALAG
ncbi:MAG TPA: HAD family hydrolase [Dehalococcoidia bacterium]|nr:HAD family hydrolase [Dehalococcoidia bacterium]